MSKLTLCDICQCIIKQGSSKYILGVNELKEGRHFSNENILTSFQKGQDEIVLYEICQECKSILEHLFKMRKKERQKTLEQIEKMYKKENKEKQNGQKL